MHALHKRLGHLGNLTVDQTNMYTLSAYTVLLYPLHQHLGHLGNFTYPKYNPHKLFPWSFVSHAAPLASREPPQLEHKLFFLNYLIIILHACARGS